MELVPLASLGDAEKPPRAEKRRTSRGGPPPKNESTSENASLHNPSVAGQSHTTQLPSPESFLDYLSALGLSGIRRLVLTSNRTTMVSFRGDHLRVHRAFLNAPEATLRAIVDFVNGRGAVRRCARRVLLTLEIPRDPGREAARRRESPHPDDTPAIERLREAHRQLNIERFGGELGNVLIRVSRRMHSRLGHFSPGRADEAAEIAVARRHIRRDGWPSAIDTLVHEMVHQWQHETGRPLAHDKDFRRKAREVGISPSARRVAGRTD